MEKGLLVEGKAKGRRRKMVKEEAGKASFHHVLTARRPTIQKIFVGSGLESNVEPATSLVMWRKYVETNQSNRDSKPKLLNMKKKRGTLVHCLLLSYK